MAYLRHYTTSFSADDQGDPEAVTVPTVTMNGVPAHFREITMTGPQKTWNFRAPSISSTAHVMSAGRTIDFEALPNRQTYNAGDILGYVEIANSGGSGTFLLLCKL